MENAGNVLKRVPRAVKDRKVLERDKSFLHAYPIAMKANAPKRKETPAAIKKRRTKDKVNIVPPIEKSVPDNVTRNRSPFSSQKTQGSDEALDFFIVIK